MTLVLVAEPFFLVFMLSQHHCQFWLWSHVWFLLLRRGGLVLWFCSLNPVWWRFTFLRTMPHLPTLVAGYVRVKGCFVFDGILGRGLLLFAPLFGLAPHLVFNCFCGGTYFLCVSCVCTDSWMKLSFKIAKRFVYHIYPFQILVTTKIPYLSLKIARNNA